MSIEAFAALLMAFHVVSGVFIGLVIKRQLGLFKSTIHANLRTYRRVLFALSVVIFAGNLNPILIDFVTFMGGAEGRPTSVKAVSISYAVSNAVVAMISAILIYILYRMASDASSNSKKALKAKV